jgi:hypothetical protein
MIVHKKTAQQLAKFRGRFGDFVYNTGTEEIRFCDGSTFGGVAIGSGEAASLPDGGTTGQVLAKQSSGDGDADWADVAGGINQATASLWGDLC